MEEDNNNDNRNNQNNLPPRYFAAFHRRRMEMRRRMTRYRGRAHEGMVIGQAADARRGQHAADGRWGPQPHPPIHRRGPPGPPPPPPVAAVAGAQQGAAPVAVRLVDIGDDDGDDDDDDDDDLVIMADMMEAFANQNEPAGADVAEVVAVVDGHAVGGAINAAFAMNAVPRQRNLDPAHLPPDLGRFAAHQRRMGLLEEPQPAVAVARPTTEVSPLLFDMIRQGCTCTSVLSGWGAAQEGEGCHRQVQQCSETPDQAFYCSPLNGRTPLHEACLRNACEHIIKALLEANPMGATERDHASNTALHLLFVDSPQHGYMNLGVMNEIVDALLQANPFSVVTSSNGSGATPLHMACSAPEPMMDPVIFRKLIAAHPPTASSRNAASQVPLALYAKQRHANVRIARILVNAYERAIVQADQEGRAPLHDAAQNLNTDLICFLLMRAPEAAQMRTRDGKTALHILCHHPNFSAPVHMRALEALVQAAPDTLSVPDSNRGQTPLHLACSQTRPSLEMIRKILEVRQGVAGRTDNDNYTALHHACDKGASVEICQLLLEAFPFAAQVVTRKQDTVLHLACGRNTSVETVRLLIAANREALTRSNDYGYSPLHCVTRAYRPSMGIVQALLETCPECVTMRTHGGETATHLACSSGAYVGVLQLLTAAETAAAAYPRMQSSPTQDAPVTTNKVGDNPLHEACFRGTSFEHIETLAKARPEWIVSRNNAGYTPLQMAAKGGRLDERVVTAFSRIRGPEVFSVIDTVGLTPLHSACREGTSEAAIKSLILAFPDALHLKTLYGDTPIHLTLLRNADIRVIETVAKAACERRHKALLGPNTAGQTPMQLAMDEFQRLCTAAPGSRFCSVTSNYNVPQQRAFDVLAILVKLVYYGPYHKDPSINASLVRACVCLHRKDVRLDPAFIRRAIHLHPEEVRQADGEGYPLHVEASIPVEKMSLLDGPKICGCGGKCHDRAGVLGTLLCAFPEATNYRNESDEFPVGLMIQNGRPWDQTFCLALRNFPPALHWYRGMDDKFIANIMNKVSKECGNDTLFELIRSRPQVVHRRSAIAPANMSDD